MAVKPVYENFCVCEKKIEKIKQLKIECKTDLLTDEIKKVLCVEVFLGKTDSSVSGGNLKYSGNALFTVIYTDANGETRKTECGVEYSDTVPTERKDNDRVSVSVTEEKCGADSVGARLIVFAYVSVETSVCSNSEVGYLTDGEDIVTDKKEETVVRNYGVKNCSFPIEEQFSVAFPIKEVLFQKARAVVTAVQCGVGTIIVDGEVFVAALLLQNNEKRDIIKEEKIIPFRVEIEYEEAMPAMRAVATVKEKSFKTDVTVDEERGESTIALSLLLYFDGEAFSEESVSVVKDLFSTTEELSAEYGNCEFIKPMEVRTCRERISGRAAANIPDGARILAVGCERADITSFKAKDDGMSLVGVLTMKAFFADADGAEFSITVESPFETETDCVLPECCNVRLKVNAVNGGARIVSSDEIETGAELIITVYADEKCAFRYVKDVKSLGEKKHNDSAISVYIPREGEELWSLAKRLSVCPENLLSSNKELQFPLTGKERIVVYRQN